MRFASATIRHDRAIVQVTEADLKKSEVASKRVSSDCARSASLQAALVGTAPPRITHYRYLAGGPSPAYLHPSPPLVVDSAVDGPDRAAPEVALGTFSVLLLIVHARLIVSLLGHHSLRARW